MTPTESPNRVQLGSVIGFSHQKGADVPRPLFRVVDIRPDGGMTIEVIATVNDSHFFPIGKLYRNERVDGAWYVRTHDDDPNGIP